MPKSKQVYALEDGSYLDHPVMRGLKLSAQLTDADLREYWNLPSKTLEFAKKESVLDVKKDPLRIFYVTTGWLYSYSDLPNGQRQVHRLYREGDMIGTEEFLDERNAFNITSASASTLVELDVDAARNYALTHPGIVSYTTRTLSHAVLLAADHMTAVARLATKARLAHFILSMLARIRWTSNVSNLSLIHLPLSQKIIGDYMGMTSVHVSRMFKALTDDGFIARPSIHIVKVIDETGLVEMSDFQDRTGALMKRLSA